uniref:ARAD1C19492p n=1 Tax=Blastobotrys adeninivorans TaxID=409370 RepID=A0A060T1D5_BLAAD
MSYTLYYLTGACSLSVHTMLADLGVDYKTVALDESEGKVGLENKEGKYQSEINPKGCAPALVHDGIVRTEALVIGLYLASLFPEKLYFPTEGEEKWKALEVANYLATDLHKAHIPLFSELAEIPQVKDFTFNKLDRSYTYLNRYLEGKQYLLGDKISPLDFYLYNIASWAGHVGYDNISKFPNIVRLQKTVGERPSALQALKEEGLA